VHGVTGKRLTYEQTYAAKRQLRVGAANEPAQEGVVG
jgi:hypothetical protein